MNPITLSAHFDGQHIELDTPYQLQPQTRLLVVVLTGMEADDERADWLRLSEAGLALAYGEDEPDYSNVPLREPNPDYDPEQ